MLHRAPRVLGYLLLAASNGWIPQDADSTAAKVQKEAMPAGVVLSRTQEGTWTLSRKVPEGGTVQYTLSSAAPDHAPSDTWVIDDSTLRALADPRAAFLGDWDVRSLHRYAKATAPGLRSSSVTEFQTPGFVSDFCAERIRKLEALVVSQRNLIAQLEAELATCRRAAAPAPPTGR